MSCLRTKHLAGPFKIYPDYVRIRLDSNRVRHSIFDVHVYSRHCESSSSGQACSGKTYDTKLCNNGPCCTGMSVKSLMSAECFKVGTLENPLSNAI